MKHSCRRVIGSRRNERGQTAIFLVLTLSLFLLAFTGLAVDYSNLWFHRQAAQGAADAACQAGAMDMYNLAQGYVSGTPAAFVPGFVPDKTKTYNCAGSSATPCWYANKNGYDGAGLTTGVESNQVQYSFPASITGVTAPPTSLTSVPFMRVDVTDRVKVYLSALLTGNKTQDVLATAKCGLVLAQAPIPIIILNPSVSGSLSSNGSKATLSVYGGPPRSIQVNSSSTTAVTSGGTIDLSQGGPNLPPTGSSLGTFGGPATPTGTFLPGTTGSWGISSPIPDPYALLGVPGSGGSAPSIPLAPTNYLSPGCAANPCAVGYHVHGCPDNNKGCLEYAPGHYTTVLQIKDSKKNGTAIFDAGLYYLDHGMTLDSLSVVRPSTYDGNVPAWGGTTFYFSGSDSVSVNSNSGAAPPGGFEPADDFDTSRVPCPALGSPPLPGNVPATLSGNILLAPCGGYYGDPGGLGQNRGILFFQDRSASANPNWGGGGAFLLSGSMYFHQCHTDGVTKTGTSCNTTTGYTTQLTLQGVSGSGTYLLGNVVTDELQLGGNPTLFLDLNPAATINILKVALLQ